MAFKYVYIVMLIGELNTKMDDRLKGHWIRNKPPILVVGGTIFSHLKHHKVSGMQNQIDYLCISKT
jgi:hypothetical protein